MFIWAICLTTFTYKNDFALKKMINGYFKHSLVYSTPIFFLQKKNQFAENSLAVNNVLRFPFVCGVDFSCNIFLSLPRGYRTSLVTSFARITGNGLFHVAYRLNRFAILSSASLPGSIYNVRRISVVVLSDMCI